MGIPNSIQVILNQLMASPSLEDVPEIAYEQVFTESDDATRAAEICLNFDKALRLLELEKIAKNRSH